MANNTMKRIKEALMSLIETFNEATTDRGILAWGSDDVVPEQGEPVWMLDENGERFEAEAGEYRFADGIHIVQVESGMCREVTEVEVAMEEQKPEEQVEMEAQEEEAVEVTEEQVETVEEENTEEEQVEETEENQVEMEDDKYKALEDQIATLTEKLDALTGKFEAFSQLPAAESGTKQKFEVPKETMDDRFNRLKHLMSC